MTTKDYLREHPGWQKKFPVGPVKFDLVCPVCHELVVECCDFTAADKQALLNHAIGRHIKMTKETK